MDLWDIPAIDQHAHPLLKTDAWSSMPFAAFFTESRDPDIIQNHVRHTLFFHRSLRDIAALLSCEPSETEIAARRRALGLEALSSRCLQVSKLAAVFLDDGFLPDAISPLQWHHRFVPVRRILRLEHLAENLLATDLQFDAWLDRFRRHIDPPPAGVAALKSIAAYRSGLAISPVSLEQARTCFDALKATSAKSGGRLSAKPLIDFLVIESMTLAARHGLPIQFHTGFGDPDLDLRNSNPLHLRWPA